MAGKKGVEHISPEERVKIEGYVQIGMKAPAIAAALGRERSAIYKELRRGRYTRLTIEWKEVTAYSAEIAQRDYEEKAAGKGPSLKIGRDFAFASFIEQKIIKERYSPAAALAAIRLEGQHFATEVCIKTLYNYIDAGIFAELENKHLLRKSKKKPKADSKPQFRAKRTFCTSISERPEEIGNRKLFGHWEMDTVIGKAKGGGPVLLVLTERLTRQEIIRKIGSKTTAEVVRVLNRLERSMGAKFKRVFQTITIDNGSEFMDTLGIEKSCRTKGSRTKVYYCHPYSSWERGSNENANGMIRRFIPKGTPIEQYSDRDIARVERWINNYPRKILGYLTAQILFDSYLEAA